MDTKKTVIWVMPRLIAWGFIGLENALRQKFQLSTIYGCLSDEPAKEIKWNIQKVEEILDTDDVHAVIYDGVTLIPGLRSILNKKRIPLIEFEVNFDEDSGYEFCDSVDRVMSELS